MINILLGPPGGGKSYEATVFHILPALAKGRKVITNLPLDLERIAQIDAAYLPLIELRTNTLAVPDTSFKPAASLAEQRIMQRLFGRVLPLEGGTGKELVQRAFANKEDYGDEWRHPDKGFGPLYVIDECHLCLPRGSTQIAVEEWFSLHRHETADVLLITQSYGKVSKSVIDLVQVCYRVKKATAFGTNDRYIRKVQDGVRGDVVNTGIRKYEPKHFGLYKSHTLGGGAELESNDIVPIWRRWPFIGAAVCFVLVVLMFTTGHGKISPIPSAQTAQAKPVQTAQAASARVQSGAGQVVQSAPGQPGESKFVGSSLPFERLELHIRGFLSSASRSLYSFQATQNGQHAFYLSQNELESTGYKVVGLSPCSAKLVFQKTEFYVTCDGAREQLVRDVPGGAGQAKQGKNPAQA